MDTETTGSYEDEQGERFEEETGAEGMASSFILGGVGPDEPLPIATADDEDEDEDDDGAEEEEGRRTSKARGSELEQERALEAGLRLSVLNCVIVINPKSGLAVCREHRHGDEQHPEDPAEARGYDQEIEAAGDRGCQEVSVPQL